MRQRSDACGPIKYQETLGQISYSLCLESLHRASRSSSLNQYHASRAAWDCDRQSPHGRPIGSKTNVSFPQSFDAKSTPRLELLQSLVQPTRNPRFYMIMQSLSFLSPSSETADPGAPLRLRTTPGAPSRPPIPPLPVPEAEERGI